MNGSPIDFPKPSRVAMVLIYRILWTKLSRRSAVSGLWLREYENTKLFPNMFCHVLPPDKYPYFRYYMKNIVLVTPGEAGLWTQATEEERIQYALDIESVSNNRDTANWAILKHLAEVLDVEYKKVFPVTNKGIVGYKYNADEIKTAVGKLNERYILSLK